MYACRQKYTYTYIHVCMYVCIYLYRYVYVLWFTYTSNPVTWTANQHLGRSELGGHEALGRRLHLGFQAWAERRPRSTCRICVCVYIHISLYIYTDKACMYSVYVCIMYVYICAYVYSCLRLPVSHIAIYFTYLVTSSFAFGYLVIYSLLVIQVGSKQDDYACNPVCNPRLTVPFVEA